MSSTQAAPTVAASPPRVLSIDALRGFDMFWIMGADAWFSSLLGMIDRPWAGQLKQQLEHVPWEGFRFYDLIFPLFLFLVGCVIPYSLAKYRERPGDAHWRLIRRGAALTLIGLMLNGLLQFEWDQLRWAGVLQRIGICYAVAGLLYLHLSPRGLVLTFSGILIGYWLIMIGIPVPGGERGDFTPAGNLAGYLDRTLLPGKIMPEYYGYGDNEGILSTIPAIATALLGVLAGLYLRSSDQPLRKVSMLTMAGLAGLVLGLLWGNFFPVIKNLWTSTFVLVAGGWSLLLLALFYGIIDVGGWRGWALPFIVIGANAILVYVLPYVWDVDFTVNFFTGGLQRVLPAVAPLIGLGGVLVCKWLLLYVLWRQKWYLRV
jgi:predicted acyltransferase